MRHTLGYWETKKLIGMYVPPFMVLLFIVVQCTSGVAGNSRQKILTQCKEKITQTAQNNHLAPIQFDGQYKARYRQNEQGHWRFIVKLTDRYGKTHYAKCSQTGKARFSIVLSGSDSARF